MERILVLSVLLQVAATLNPIILLPGYTGSRLEASIHKSKVVKPWCKRIVSKSTIWLNVNDMSPLNSPCFADNMKMIYDYNAKKFIDNEGVNITVPDFGSTESIEYLDETKKIKDGEYYKTLVDYFVNLGYQRNVSIRGAPYDWRKAAKYQDGFMKDLKWLVEETYEINGNKTVVLVGHSMGCLMLLRFLNLQTSDWKEMYVKSFVSVAGPLAGSVSAFIPIISGVNLNNEQLNPLVMRKMIRTFTSVYSFIPYPIAWNDSEIIIDTPTNMYSLKNVSKIFTEMEYPIGLDMWNDLKDEMTEDLVPGVEAHCIYGLGAKTLDRISYGEKFPSANPVGGSFGLGDGAVNQRSLDACTYWSKQKEPFFKKVFPKYDHIGIVKNEDVFDYIYDVANK